MVMNVKKMTQDIFLAFGASLTASGLLAFALDHNAWPHVLAACLATTHVGAAPCIVLFVILNSISPAVIEGTDTFFVSRAFDAAEGGDFWPGKKEFWVSFKKAALCGMIASFGSVPANIVGLTSGYGWLPAGILANEVQQVTSASLIPFEVIHAENYLTAAVMANTFLRKFYRYRDEDVQQIMDKNAKVPWWAFWREKPLSREFLSRDGSFRGVPGVFSSQQSSVFRETDGLLPLRRQ